MSGNDRRRTCRACVLGDGNHAVDAILSVEKSARARRSLPRHGRRAGRQPRSRDSRLAAATSLHPGVSQGDAQVTLYLCCYFILHYCTQWPASATQSCFISVFFSYFLLFLLCFPMFYFVLTVQNITVAIAIMLAELSWEWVTDIYRVKNL